MTRVQKKELFALCRLVLISSVLGLLFSIVLSIILHGEIFSAQTMPILSLGFCTGSFVSLFLHLISKGFDQFAPLPLWVVFFVQPLVFALAITVVYGSFFLLFLGLPQFKQNSYTIQTLLFSFLITTLILFFENLERLLGENVLRGLIFGTYRKPIKESRFVMFLDIAGSTGIAEKLGDIGFHAFLNDFFCDISATILNCRGEIYKYVGDEIIITWKERTGIKNQYPLAVFFEIDTKIKSRATYYQNRYGLIPLYRAGLHFGSLVAGEMGLHKQEIAFTGDVMNTTSRIQSECRVLGERFLVSSNALEKLCPADSKTPFCLIVSRGSSTLRGKTEEIEIHAVHGV